MLRKRADVRFGSQADICAATSDVCFTPNSDRESEIPPKAMSALPPKADMCGATCDVRFGPIADSCTAARTSLFDHLEAKRLGGLHIEHGLVFRSNFARSSAAISLAKA